MDAKPANQIIYWAERLADNRAQLHRDVVVDGEMVPELSHPVGSPAPLDVVARHERTLPLGKAGRS